VKRTATTCNCHKTFQSRDAQKEKACCSQEFVFPEGREGGREEAVAFPGVGTQGRKPSAT